MAVLTVPPGVLQHQLVLGLRSQVADRERRPLSSWFSNLCIRDIPHTVEIYSYKTADNGFNLTVLAVEEIPIHIENVYMFSYLAGYPISGQIPFIIRPCYYTRCQLV